MELSGSGMSGVSRKAFPVGVMKGKKGKKLEAGEAV
jgi:hypothetical protein